MFGFFKKRRRRKLLVQEIPKDWRQIIERNVAIYERLTARQQTRVQDAARIIVAERSFVGSGGQVVTDEVKVTIAAQTALLLLGDDGYYFDRVPTIFVYPVHQTVQTRHDLAGAQLIEEDVAIEGQIIEQGEIRLAWDDVLYGCRDPADGENVVLHEFAHHLDRLDGVIDGMPPLATHDLRQRWMSVFDKVLARLRRDQSRGRQTFLHDEASENRAELFAYSTECFFEQPHDLEEFHPELFDCLLGFYKTDPRPWFA